MFLHDQETAVDLLYYEPIARTVCRLITSAGGKPLSVGIHGDWGAGKSSVLKMVERDFKAASKAASGNTVTVWFNGWAFEGYDDAKSVVIETIVDELRRARPGDVKVADAAMKVLRRVDWLKVAKRTGGLAFNLATGLPSPDQVETMMSAAKALMQKPADHLGADDVKSLVKSAGDFLKDKDDAGNTVPAQIHAFRDEFEDLLKHARVDRLIVLVDDLDRCLPETAIATLEAIRLFLFVPKTAFIIAADEAMIEYWVRRHFPDLPASSGPASYARNYLEKLIQVPFRIPAMGGAETRTYVTLLLSQAELGEDHPDFVKLLDVARETMQRPWAGEVLDRTKVEKALGIVPQGVDEAIRIAHHISPVLANGTHGNPRQVKRFLNTIALRAAVAEDRGFGDQIERAVLAKLMLAERFAPEAFEQVAREVNNTGNGHSALMAHWEAKGGKGEGASKDEKKLETKGRAAPKAETTPDSEWAFDWASIEPAIAGKDLRPYVFVSRDKRAYFGSLAGAGHLQDLLNQLLGERMAAAGAAGEVRKLGPTDAEQLFDALRMKVLEAEDLTKTPAGAAGLAVLVTGHPPLQSRLLAFLEGLTPSKIGAWAATNWAGCFNSPSAAKFANLCAVWAEEGSKTLKVVAATAASAGRR